jgi:hypothetical protein
MEFQENYPTSEGEIDIISWLRVIFKRKITILVVFLLTVGATVFFSLWQPKTYKVDAILEVAMIDGKPVKSADQLIEESNIYVNSIKEKLGISGAGFPKIKFENPKDTDFVKMEAVSPNPERVKTIFEEMIKLIEKDQIEVTNNEKDLLARKIELLKKDMEIKKKSIDNLKLEINLLLDEKKNLENKEKILENLGPYDKLDQGLTGSLFLLIDVRKEISTKKEEIEKNNSQINEIESEINSLQLDLDSTEQQMAGIKPMEIIKAPTVSENSMSSRFLFNTVIAAILGIFLGTFLAFSKEWWGKNKGRI